MNEGCLLNFCRCIVLQIYSVQTQVDALVNSTTADMNLQSNPSAMALSAVAGPTLQQQCTSKAPLSDGGLCVTSGGNLDCKKVFHINVKDEQVIKWIILKWLSELAVFSDGHFYLFCNTIFIPTILVFVIEYREVRKPCFFSVSIYLYL